MLKNQLYAFEKSLANCRVHRIDINNTGAFCIWELGIVSHERTAWKKYLASGGTPFSKGEYIASAFEGDL